MRKTWRSLLCVTKMMHSVLDNVGAPIWRRLAGRLGLLRDNTVRMHTLPFIEKLEVRTPSLAQTVGNLSGGERNRAKPDEYRRSALRQLSRF